MSTAAQQKVAWFLFFLVVFTALAYYTPTDAQADCDLPALLEAVRASADAAEAADDDTAALAELDAAVEAIGATKAACEGLAFSGDAESVIGPVTIPEGVYRAVVTTENYVIVHVEALDGECGEGMRMRSSSLFNLSAGDATDGAEAIFASEECSALIEVENVRGDWLLTFERVD